MVTNLLEAFDRRISTNVAKQNTSMQGRKSMAALINERRSTVHYNRTKRNVHFKTPSKYEPKESLVNSAYVIDKGDEMGAS